VAAKAFDALGLPRANILGFTMPGFATSEGTKANAWALMTRLGVTGEEIDIRRPLASCWRTWTTRSRGARPVYDVTFENVQAGLAQPTTCSAGQPAERASCWAPATCRNWRWAGAPTASATR
jgi:hypothetical protein